MRINKFVALATGMSRRAADKAIEAGDVYINKQPAKLGDTVAKNDVIHFKDAILHVPEKTVTILLNKPVGYVCSRNGQGSKTIYELLPYAYRSLKPVGRLDKDSSGLLLLTNDGTLANELTHPSKQKQKVYEITLDKPLEPLHQQMIADYGIALEDGISKFIVEPREHRQECTVRLSEGRNRQIRRTFAALGYTVKKLHRTSFGPYTITNLAIAHYSEVL